MMIKEKKTKAPQAYTVLEDSLRRKIISGELAAGAALEAESSLAQYYKISRNTARKALSNLAAEGLVRKVQGRGSFVASHDERPKLRSKTLMFRLIQDNYNSVLELRGQLNDYDKNLVCGILENCFYSDGKIEKIQDTMDADFAEITRQYRNNRLHGVIWERPAQKYFPLIERLRDAKVPQVTISRSVPGIPSIFFDAEASLRRTVNFLCDIGHSRIVFLDREIDYPLFKMRQRAFISEIRKRGIPDAEKYQLNARCSNDLKEQFNKIPDGVTAIITGSLFVDNLFGWCIESGIRIPEDISIISLSSENSRELQEHPDVSAILEPRREIGFKAVDILKQLNKGEDVSVMPMKLKGKLVINGSCASPASFIPGNGFVN
jgi:DNA-binding LacI/PurR family transcriptional regulator